MMPSMPSKLTVPQQCNCLQTLRKDVEVFGSHEIALIKRYYSKTGVCTDVITIFEKMRQDLENNAGDFQTYEAVRNKFMEYIEKRVKRLQDTQEGHGIDPWMELSLTTKDNNLSEQLREVSHQIQDVLFTSELVVDYGLAGEVELPTEELHRLNNKLATDYFSKLRPMGQNATTTELEKTLLSELAQLEKNVQHKNFDEAKKELQKIRQDLKVSAAASSLKRN